MSDVTAKPGVTFGSYPQKLESELPEFEQAVVGFFRQLTSRFTRKNYSLKQLVRKVEHYQQAIAGCSEQELNRAIRELRTELHRKGLQTSLIFKAFAVIRETAARVLKKSHYDVQLYGGWLMINGMLAEMQTGEGKTLTMTLPSCTAALAGIPVHVITANDYLASRDCEIMLPLYIRLGLTAAPVVEGMDNERKQESYQADIVHTTNKQLAFDYLRDRIEMGDDTGPLRFQYRQIQRQQPGSQKPLLLRGLCFALVDEADSVLIDEAKTPLIITKPIPNEESPDTYSDALYLASILYVGQDYTIDAKLRQVELTETGEEKLAEMIQSLPAQWHSKRKREMLVTQAITATQFYKRDKHYVVDEDKVKIIDESTGRLMPDRTWEQGLHQMIEAKEGCVISELREPLARISYQRFFSRYLKLGGTSGTLSEVKKELHQVHGLDVVKVPTFRPSKRIMMKEKLFRNEAVKKQAFQQRIAQLYEQRRPVLIGTCSVEESELVSAWLHENNIDHKVLNAKQDQHEAAIVAKAGMRGSITVATNMAGRGTDIALGPGVKESGGLHVVALSRNGSHRIDRQLYGRCARQGDPGSAEAILSLEDPALQQFYSASTLKLFASLTPGKLSMPGFISKRVLRLPQHKNEKEKHRMRKQLMRQDRRLQRTLAFSGKFE